MPFYEYQCVDKSKSCKLCINKFEVMHGIKEPAISVCSECGNKVERLISQISGVIWKGRTANQYNDIKMAKYWRDADGNKWPVGEGDGRANAPTVSRKRKRSPEQVKNHIAIEKKIDKKKRNQASYNRFLKQIRK